MTCEGELAPVLAALAPRLDPQSYVFATCPGNPAAALADEALGWFREAEGTTLILAAAAARDFGLEHSKPMRRIVLGVASDLELAGLIACVGAVLADRGIAVNPVAGYYHDHLFVPSARASNRFNIKKAPPTRRRRGFRTRGATILR